MTSSAQGRIHSAQLDWVESWGADRMIADGFMRHDWIFAVLEDLRSYALANGLPATAAQAEEALRVARAEVRPGLTGLPPETGRRH